MFAVERYLFSGEWKYVLVHLAPWYVVSRIAHDTEEEAWKDKDRKPCYQCDALVDWLAPDSRCAACTRVTPEKL